MKKQRGFTVVELIGAVVLIAVAWGWVWNIIKICSSDLDHVTGMFVARCFGVVVPPLGAVLGFL